MALAAASAAVVVVIIITTGVRVVEVDPEDREVVVEVPVVVVEDVLRVVVVVEVVVVVVVVEVAYSRRVAVLVRLLHFSSGHWHRVQSPVKSHDCTGERPARPQPLAVLVPSRHRGYNCMY